MVLFTEPRLAGRILAGKKTTHTIPRRLKPRATKPPCTSPPTKVAAPWHPNEICPVQVEQRKEDPATGDKVLSRGTVFHVRVTAIWPCLLNEFDDKAAGAEGFENAGELFRWWYENHLKIASPASTDRPTMEVPVWTAAVVLAETNRYLAAGPVDPFHVPADERGYVFSPVRAADDAAVIEEDRLNLYALENRQGDADRERLRRALWERQSLADRAAELERIAPGSGADVSKELRLAGHALGKAYEKINRMDKAA